MMKSDKIKLEIKNIKKSFSNKFEQVIVLDNLSFNIQSGEFLSILGPSGCGKSTLLRLLAGFDKPDGGNILLEGSEKSKPGINSIMVFQDFNQLFPWKTVMQNVMFGLEVNKLGGTKVERVAMAMTYLEMVKLKDFSEYYPHQLSGGMKQRAALARALALNPELLLMDEPFGSLDAQARMELQTMLLELWGVSGTTIVFVTHDISEALTLSDRILIMSRNSKGIKKIVHNTLPRPRLPQQKGYGELWQEIFEGIEVLE